MYSDIFLYSFNIHDKSYSDTFDLVCDDSWTNLLTQSAFSPFRIRDAAQAVYGTDECFL